MSRHVTNATYESHLWFLYLVAAGSDVRSQSLHLTVEDVVFHHVILHRWQVLAKTLVVKVVLSRGKKQDILKQSWL